MKKNITLLAIAMIGMTAFFSCKKKDNSPSTTMTATINGAAYSTSNCISAVNDTILVVYGGITSASTLTYPFVELTVSGYTGVGTYNITGFTGAVVDSSASTGLLATSGTIKITGTSPISGTFSFTSTDYTSFDTVQVTNGAFTSSNQ